MKRLLSLSFVSVLFTSIAGAQGAAPETAPPLFPGGGLISYNSVFTTRGPVPQSSAIPATARPTFSHEGEFNFTWGFHRDLDLTVLVPIVTNHGRAGVEAASLKCDVAFGSQDRDPNLTVTEIA